MPKWKTFYDYNRKYNTDWEGKFVWVKKAPEGTENAYCKLCHCNILPRLSNLSNHEKSEKHKRNAPSASQTTLFATKQKKQVVVDEKVKVAELQLAVAMTCHSAIRTVDHLGEILVKLGEGSPLSQIKLHRTKCSNLIKFVISATLKQELTEDLRGKKFAIITDESTDVSTQKFLCVMLRYYSSKKEEISTAFLSLISIQEATGENIFNLINEEIKSCGLTLKDCIGFAADGASNMMGCTNSAWTRMKEASPYCVQLKCICHSLALCIQYAFGKLPSNIGFLLIEIPKWFGKSSIRREAFKDLFHVINSEDSDLTRIVPLPFEKASRTRWLVRGKVLFNILMNWEELKAYFMSVEIAEVKMETRFKARLIKEMLLDWKNFLYFHFATPVVQEFEKVNSLFQKTKANPQDLNDELSLHHKSLKARLYDARNNKKSIACVDFGAKFLFECNNILKQHNNSLEVQREIAAVKERCLNMLEEALIQVEKRLPPEKHIYKDLTKLNPEYVLNQATRPAFSELPFLHLAEDNLSVIEEQYRKLPFVDWREEFFKEAGIPKDCEEFWKGVLLQHNQFKELATFALTCLVTPVSNAVVERVFSLLSAVKTKQRNRLKLPLVEAILRVRTEFLLRNKCCKDFVPSQMMLKNFKSEYLYPSKSSENEDFGPSDEEFF